MASAESSYLRDLYKGWSDRMAANPNLTIADLRDLFNEWAKAAFEPEDVTYRSDSVAGVDAIWANPAGCDKSKVLIYTQGGGFAVGSADSNRKLAAHVGQRRNYWMMRFVCARGLVWSERNAVGRGRDAACLPVLGRSRTRGGRRDRQDRGLVQSAVKPEGTHDIRA